MSKREPKDVLPLSYELIYRRYRLNRGKGAGLFTELSISEYIALHILVSNTTPQSVYTQKTYLRQLAEQMQTSIHTISAMITKLKNRGFVSWSHDGAGEEGTYVILTPSGFQAMQRQEQLLKHYYAQVIEQFGQERLTALLQEMKQLDAVMDSVYEKEGGASDEEQLD
ncbi:MAG: MarR family transcriptional regulator [Oscillospiraceae bacterium]|nr:MarR family transcriptional regulator [Oscillospiraceae bacterium]MCD8331233.1 MarR family transcriptional regulator [Oscillospiraceae bacterium]